MSLPTFTFEVGFVAAPLDLTPVFTNLAADLETLAISRGRQGDTDQAQTGTANATLIDDGRRYDPDNTAGAYYPNVQVMKPVRVVATLDAVTYPMFYGWIDVQNGWVRLETEAGFATVLVPCNDGFEIINNARMFWVDTSLAPAPTSGLGTDCAQQLSGPRIRLALGQFISANKHFGMYPAYPTTWTSIDDGLATVQASPATSNVGATPLQLVRDAELTEPGFFFFDGAGRACFRDRRSRPQSSSLATFCDTHNLSAGRVLYDSVTTRRTAIVNDARATRAGGTLQEAVDTTSQGLMLTRAQDYSTQHVDDASTLDYAKWMLSLKKDSYEVLETLTLVPGTDSPTWLQILSRELNDRITVVRTPPPGTGVVVTRDYFIEKIDITWGPGPDAKCVWRLSPASPFNYWLAGTAGSSEAGTTTRAAY